MGTVSDKSIRASQGAVSSAQRQARNGDEGRRSPYRGAVPSPDEIVTFLDDAAPPGASPFVAGAQPDTHLVLADHDPAWPSAYDVLRRRVEEALGERALLVQHIGSTSVPGLAAKPVIDLDLLVSDPDDEDSYVPPLEAAGFVLRVREPWWHRHRMLRAEEPRANLHVFGEDSPEPVKHRIFRDWLREREDDRELYARVKAEAVAATNARGEDVMLYNAHKSALVREIYARAFSAAGLLEP